MSKAPLHQGLTSTEALERLRRYGRNVLPMHQRSKWTIFLSQFQSAIVILLLIAACVSWAVHDISGAVIIAIIIAVNAILGFVQEARADRKLYDISTLVQPTASVKRDGVIRQIPREEIVVGDLVQITAGTIAPADIELQFADGLSMNESSISGESFPVEKSLPDGRKVEMGTIAVRGMGEGLVTAIGAAAVLGEIINLAETDRPTNFEKEIQHLSELCIGIIVLTSAVLFFTKLAISPDKALSIDFIIFLLAICIGILPETLPLIATVALSTGAMKLAKMGVVVRRLSAIRDLGSITVLCSDKTGTLTENTLKAAEKMVCSEEDFRDVLAIAKGIGDRFTDPFQQALCAMDAGTDVRPVELLHAIPFDADRRSAGLIVHLGGEEMKLTQGAFEVIVGEVRHPCDRPAMEEWIRKREATGQRILAFALEHKGQTHIAALISFIDPLRATAWKSIDHAQRLGITVKIISGDSELVSASIAKQLGLIHSETEVMSGFQWEKLSLSEKAERVALTPVFARFLPAQKYEVIKLLQERGEIVGYIGDGVNDAPSLKLADVGISVSNGTDIAKSSSDIILLQRGLGVVVGGIQQGRAVFENVSKYLRETLTENLGNFLSISVLSLMIPYLPMLPIQILVTNLITDFPHLAIATDSVDAASLRRPRHLQMRTLLRFMILLSFVSSAGDMTYFALMRHMPVSSVQTGWFVFSTLAEIATIFSVRSRNFFFRGKGPSRFLVLSSAAVAVFVIGAAYVQPIAAALKLVELPLPLLGTIAAVVVGYFLTFDLLKRTIYAYWPETY